MPDVHKRRERKSERSNNEQTVAAKHLLISNGQGQCDEQHLQQANVSFASVYILMLTCVCFTLLRSNCLPFPPILIKINMLSL